jgi:hypothetical protein
MGHIRLSNYCCKYGRELVTATHATYLQYLTYPPILFITPGTEQVFDGITSSSRLGPIDFGIGKYFADPRGNGFATCVFVPHNEVQNARQKEIFDRVFRICYVW